MILTVRLSLNVTPEQAGLFSATAELFARSCGYAAELALANKTYHPVGIQKLAYGELKKMGLGAQHACLACRQVADAYKVGDKSKPRKFRPDMAVPMDVRTFSVRGDVASIWTPGGRQKVGFRTGSKQAELLRKGAHKQADLVFQGGDWFLLVSVEMPSPAKQEPVGVLGVDLGIVNLAVDSDGEVFSGGQVKKVRLRRATARATFQKRGSRSARRHLKRMAGRERRFQQWVNHNVSRRLIDKARRQALSVAIEDLKGLGKRKETAVKPVRKALGGWAFFQLRQFITYKGELAGVCVDTVTAAYSSQTCSACGHCEKANRKTRERFVCVSCGHDLPADENAARVIRARGAISRPHKGRPHGQAQSPRL